jgi:hypothetical protein
MCATHPRRMVRAVQAMTIVPKKADDQGVKFDDRKRKKDVPAFRT